MIGSVRKEDVHKLGLFAHLVKIQCNVKTVTVFSEVFSTTKGGKNENLSVIKNRNFISNKNI